MLLLLFLLFHCPDARKKTIWTRTAFVINFIIFYLHKIKQPSNTLNVSSLKMYLFVYFYGIDISELPLHFKLNQNAFDDVFSKHLLVDWISGVHHKLYYCDIVVLADSRHRGGSHCDYRRLSASSNEKETTRHISCLFHQSNIWIYVCYESEYTFCDGDVKLPAPHAPSHITRLSRP